MYAFRSWRTDNSNFLTCPPPTLDPTLEEKNDIFRPIPMQYVRHRMYNKNSSDVTRENTTSFSIDLYSGMFIKREMFVSVFVAID